MSQSLFSDEDSPWHETFNSKELSTDTTGIDHGCVEDYEEEFPALEKELGEETEGGQLATNALLTPGERLHLAAVKVQAAVKFTKLERLKRRARWATKKLIVFVLSHVGLTFLVVLYAIAGGFIFLALEGNSSPPNTTNTESTSAARITPDFTASFNLSIQQHGWHYVQRLWNNTISYNILHPGNWSRDMLLELEMFAWQVYYTALHEMASNGTDDVDMTTVIDTATKETVLYNKQKGRISNEVIEWTYPRALLFAVTIITTIGYGDTVPTSLEGKIVCIIYATLGIPMTLLCLANIGSLMASVYRFTWKHVSHVTLIITRSPARNDPTPETSRVHVPVIVSLATMAGYILGGAVIFSTWEGWSYIDGSYFCFVTLSTIGFGDFVPGKKGDTFESNTKRVVCALYLLFGLALLSMVFQLIQDSVLEIVNRYASLLGLSESKIEKDIEDCTGNEISQVRTEDIRSDDTNKDTPKYTLETAYSEKTIAYPIQESTDASLSGETYKRFIDVARSVKTNEQQLVSPIPECQKKQLKVTYRLHPGSKDRSSSQGYSQVNTV